MPSRTVGDGELRYTDTGAGCPVVLVHGLGSDHTVWDAVAPLLAWTWRVLAPDLRGHGLSASRPDRTRWSCSRGT